MKRGWIPDECHHVMKTEMRLAQITTFMIMHACHKVSNVFSEWLILFFYHAAKSAALNVNSHFYPAHCSFLAHMDLSFCPSVMHERPTLAGKLVLAELYCATA